MASKRDPSDTLAPCLRIQVYLIECVGSDQLFNICMQYIKRECGNSRKLLCKLECGGTVQVYHQGLFQTPFYFILQQTRQVDRAYLYLVFTQCCSACPFYSSFSMVLPHPALYLETISVYQFEKFDDALFTALSLVSIERFC